MYSRQPKAICPYCNYKSAIEVPSRDETYYCKNCGQFFAPKDFGRIQYNKRMRYLKKIK